MKWKLIEKIMDSTQKIKISGIRQFVKDEIADTQIDTMSALAMGIVTLVIIGAVGLFVANKIVEIAAITSGDVFYTASGTLTSITNTGFSMLLIAVVATLAGVVIAAIYWK